MQWKLGNSSWWQAKFLGCNLNPCQYIFHRTKNHTALPSMCDSRKSWCTKFLHLRTCTQFVFLMMRWWWSYGVDIILWITIRWWNDDTGFSTMMIQSPLKKDFTSQIAFGIVCIFGILLHYVAYMFWEWNIQVKNQAFSKNIWKTLNFHGRKIWNSIRAHIAQRVCQYEIEKQSYIDSRIEQHFPILSNHNFQHNFHHHFGANQTSQRQCLENMSWLQFGSRHSFGKSLLWREILPFSIMRSIGHCGLHSDISFTKIFLKFTKLWDCARGESSSVELWETWSKLWQQLKPFSSQDFVKTLFLRGKNH